MNIPEYYEDLSLRLTEVLDVSGLRDDLRWRRINTWLQIEEVDNRLVETYARTNTRTYYFGSQTEATTTLGLSSDIDQVVCSLKFSVIQDLQFWVPSLDTERTFLMVADKSTPPGYVKLHLVQRDAPMTVCNYQDKDILLDTEGRSVLYNGVLETRIDQFDRHGPAHRAWNWGMPCDNVYAIPSRCWPDQVSQRMSTARRNYSWPTMRMMDVIKQTTMFLVPVRQKLSPQQHLEWRLSFSFAEKLMMMQFNSTQYKCYVMLKFIKKTFINVDDMENVLTSYHCKTCMFYLIGNTPAFLWHPNNLMLCVDLCLKQLLSWVQCGKCPNYFVPDENMFFGKLEGPVQGEIASILQDLLRHNGRYITKIHYENIGENLIRVYQSLRIEVRSADENIIAQTIAYLVYVLNAFCLCSSYFNIWKLSLLKSQYGPRQEIDNVVRAIVCSVAGIYLASQSLKPEMYNREKLIVAHELLLWGSSSDVASGKLKLAIFYLALGNLETMEEVLNQVNASFTHIVCEEGYTLYSTLSKLLHEDLSKAKFIQNCVAFKVCYNKSDIHIIPNVLIYEIFKSTGSELVVDVIKSQVYPIAEVKARIYLYFLQYQCFHLQGQVAQRCVALNNMIWVCKDYFAKIIEITESMTIRFDRQAVHTEIPVSLKVLTTSLNIMAYCLKQDRRLMDAFKVLCASMKLTNQNNGAKWQIATFINSAFRIL